MIPEEFVVSEKKVQTPVEGGRVKNYETALKGTTKIGKGV